jgi:hypothetical protein
MMKISLKKKNKKKKKKKKKKRPIYSGILVLLIENKIVICLFASLKEDIDNCLEVCKDIVPIESVRRHYQ